MKCSLCDREFKNLNGLYRHAHNTHKLSTKEYFDRFIEPFEHKCPYCGNERTWHNVNYLLTCNDNSCKLKQREKTLLQRYGVKNASQALEIKQKKKQTCLEHFGVTIPAKSPTIRKKMQETCLNKFGVKNIFQLDSVKKKAKKSRIEHRDEWIAKFTESNRKNHGGVHYFQTLEAQKDKFKKIEYNGNTYDSNWEVAFVKFLTEHETPFVYHPTKIAYEYNGEEHYYFPDFLVNSQLVEIKGDYLLERMKTETDSLEHAKYECMLANNVRILSSVELKKLGILKS